MPSIKETKDEALAIINSAIAILDKYPDLDQVDMSLLSANISTNPFQFLMDAFKSCAGYNTLINIISSFISTQLPIVEVAVKTALLTNMKNLLSCSINPFITDEMLREGIVFNLDEIDLIDTLRYSPMSEIGKYYYFGCDDCKTSDDIRDTAYIYNVEDYSPDMNALLWYLKTKGIRREVWGRKLEKGISEAKSGDEAKQERKSGIITLEYHEDSRSISDATGNKMYTQTPYNNVLHVFIGNVRESSPNNTLDTAETNLRNINSDIVDILSVRDKALESLDKYIDFLKEEETKYLNNKLTEEQYKEKYSILITHITELKNLLYSENGSYYPTNNNENKTASVYTIDELYGKIITAVEQNDPNPIKDTPDDGSTGEEGVIYHGIETILKAAANQRKTNEQTISSITSTATTSTDNPYRQSIEDNYYYHKTLIEFNYDYIMSLKLFDSKVVTAQLLDSLTGMLSINLDLSYKSLMIRDQITEMVKMIVETDDAVVSDCFFTFSNDEYNSMLEKTELKKAGLFSTNGEQNTTTKIDAEKILESLNGINSSASQQTIQSTIEGALTEISGTINTFNYEDKDQLNFNAQFNFIENLMNNLAMVIARAVLSPKVYLLILINLKTLGQDTNFKLEDFIKKFKQLIVSLLRVLRDAILEYLVTELMKILGSLAKEIATKIAIEQAEYYARLIKKIFACFRSSGSTLDFNIDDVSADIYDIEESPKNNEC